MKSNPDDIEKEIEILEKELLQKHGKLADLKRQLPCREVSNYTLKNPGGDINLSDLFGNKSDLIVIHNMGKSCRYCTMWADGFNGVRHHLSDRAAFVVISPDNPEVQKEFATERGWEFPMASGEGNAFIEDMGFKDEDGCLPGVSTLKKDDDGKIYRIASAPFGPFDQFCSVWHIIALLTDGENDWSPKYSYEAEA